MSKMKKGSIPGRKTPRCHCHAGAGLCRLDVLKVVGIVGPYYGNGNFFVIEKNIIHAECYAIALANRGIPFYCGHLHTRHFEKKAGAPESFYKKQDMYFLVSACSALLVVPGFETSPGTKAEIAEFQKLGRPIFYPKSTQDLEELERWYRAAARKTR